ncbi:MAG: MMPL family transporter [Clostridia bacterium]|nr:MMPL family transporter [Clostridia bacterium]
MNKIYDFVIKKPKLIIIVAALLIIPCIVGFIFTDVNYDILTYLPGKLDSVKGEQILTDTYNAGSATMVLVKNMSSKNVVRLKNKISQVENVSNVLWADDVIDTSVPSDILPDSVKNVFYSDDGEYTMMFVLFSRDSSSKDKLDAVREIKSVTGKECLLSGLTPISADTRELSNRQLPIYVGLAVVLALAIMLITMESTVLPFILLIVLGMAVIYNMGTNMIFGSVSYITQCIAAILQLGVTMDYSIFLVNRYSEEKSSAHSKEEAMKNALSASFTSLAGSSMTTLFGFLALCFMQLAVGFNIGMVMAKGVLLGLASVLVILPAFLLVFDKAITKHTHKKHMLNFKKPVKFSLKKRKAFAAAFVIALIPALLLAANVKKYYNLTSTLPDDLNSVVALDTLKKEFNMTTTHFIVVHDNISAEKLLNMETKLQNVDGIDSLIAYNLYAGTSIPDSVVPDSITDVIKQGGYQVMLANSEYDAATDESNRQVEKMYKIVKECDPEGYITGEGAMYNDLIGITRTDFTVTSIISILAIFVLIAFIFKSVSIPAILIASIEFAILINEAVSTIFGATIPFIAPTIISCVQLGATVDYAILLTSRFKEEISLGNSRKKSIRKASVESMRSIFQSALIFFAVTFGVYLVSSITIVKEVCVMLARGSVISALVILFFLTPILYLCEPFIAKTTKGWPKVGVRSKSAPDTEKNEGTYIVNSFDFDDSSFISDSSFTQFNITDDE